ncbi:MAG: hypothetical protein U5K31_06325 [Balneolaceae bacterium]|nr:hypothetical protein [Balneolaceae bacterium]
MLLKTIAVMVLIYLLVKVIARVFLPASARRNAHIIFRTFRNLNRQMNEQKQRQKGSASKGPDGRGDRFDEIEEAEYEEIQDEDSKS